MSQYEVSEIELEQERVLIDVDFINNKKYQYSNSRYNLPKWITFCEEMINSGFEVTLYDSKTTESKYIYVCNVRTELEVKVRFSRHKPNFKKEAHRDCDFYVGPRHGIINNTSQIVNRVIQFLTNPTEDQLKQKRYHSLMNDAFPYLKELDTEIKKYWHKVNSLTSSKYQNWRNELIFNYCKTNNLKYDSTELPDAIFHCYSNFNAFSEFVKDKTNKRVRRNRRSNERRY